MFSLDYPYESVLRGGTSGFEQTTLCDNDRAQIATATPKSPRI